VCEIVGGYIHRNKQTGADDMTKTISIDGDTWQVISMGTERDGKVYCHLKSTTRGRQQRNGWNPIQMCDWIDLEVIQAA
jgi:hypothetical protein